MEHPSTCSNFDPPIPPPQKKGGPNDLGKTKFNLSVVSNPLKNEQRIKIESILLLYPILTLT